MAVMLSSGARQIERVVGQILRPVGRDAESDADARDQRDRGVDDQQPLPPHVGQRGAAEQWAKDESGHPDDDHERHRAHAKRLVVEQPEDQRVGDGRHRRGGDAEPGAQGDEFPCRGDGDDAQAQQAEHGEADQQHASASEAVGHRSGGEQQATERQRVRAGDPLQRGRAAPEVATDRGQRDRQQRVVDHLDEERQAEGGQRDPRRAQGRVGRDGERVIAVAVIGCSVGRGVVAMTSASAEPLTSRAHATHTALTTVRDRERPRASRRSRVRGAVGVALDRRPGPLARVRGGRSGGWARDHVRARRGRTAAVLVHCAAADSACASHSFPGSASQPRSRPAALGPTGPRARRGERSRRSARPTG